MKDPERRLRQVLARHIQFRAEHAARDPLMRARPIRKTRSFSYGQAAGDQWDRAGPFGHFDRLMADG
jgi:hypothetical protein